MLRGESIVTRRCGHHPRFKVLKRGRGRGADYHHPSINPDSIMLRGESIVTRRCCHYPIFKVQKRGRGAGAIRFLGTYSYIPTEHHPVLMWCRTRHDLYHVIGRVLSSAGVFNSELGINAGHMQAHSPSINPGSIMLRGKSTLTQ